MMTMILLFSLSPVNQDHAKGAAAREPCGSEILVKVCQNLLNGILLIFG